MAEYCQDFVKFQFHRTTTLFYKLHPSIWSLATLINIIFDNLNPGNAISPSLCTRTVNTHSSKCDLFQFY